MLAFLINTRLLWHTVNLKPIFLLYIKKPLTSQEASNMAEKKKKQDIQMPFLNEWGRGESSLIHVSEQFQWQCSTSNNVEMRNRFNTPLFISVTADIQTRHLKDDCKEKYDWDKKNTKKQIISSFRAHNHARRIWAHEHMYTHSCTHSHSKRNGLNEHLLAQ